MRSQRVEYLKTDFVKGFPAFCGIEAGQVDSGFFESFLRPGTTHQQREGFVHAGLLATMADHTGGYAGYTLVPESHRILTIEFKINFFRPATGELIACESRVINQGKKIIIAESELYSKSRDIKKLVSKATITLISIPGEDFA